VGTRRRAVRVAALASMAWALAVVASPRRARAVDDQPGEPACRELLDSIKADCPKPGEAAKPSTFAVWCGQPLAEYKCHDLATLLGRKVITQARGGTLEATAAREESDAAVARLKQPDRRTSTNKSGSSAQVEPVESIQPITLAGGALSLAGTRTGTQGVATITVNPLALAGPTGAVPGRLFDLSVIAPFNLDSGAQDHIRFVGARARVNATAGFSAQALDDALTAYGHAAGQYDNDLEGVLRRSPNLRLCAESIQTTGHVTADACGETVEDEHLRKLTQDSYAAIARAQREADRYYLGLDLRFDRGDPTGGDVVGDDGTRLAGAVAAGVRLNSQQRWNFELRARAGVDYFRSRDVVNGVRPDPVVSGTWGAALILSGHATSETDKQRMAFGVGMEGRHAKQNASADVVPTNFVNLNLMAVVPAASGGDMGVAVSIPVNDSTVPRGTIVTISTDLGLLDGSGPGASSGGK
jgi:hypothetical protein